MGVWRNLNINRVAKYIALTLFSALLSACGGESDSDQGIAPFSYDCSVFPEQLTSPYILPYEIGGEFIAYPHAVKTEPNSQNPAAVAQFYAVDFIMPIGTPIVAVRSGVVVRVEERFEDTDHQPGHENFIFVEQDDGTYARYLHLTHNGANVAVGDFLNQYQQIGLSGDTGNSTEPHLHLDVVDSACDPYGDINGDLRRCTTVPVTFRNTVSLDCGVELGESYPAFSF